MHVQEKRAVAAVSVVIAAALAFLTPAAADSANDPQDDELAAIMSGNTVAAPPGSHGSRPESWRSEEVEIALESLEKVEVKAAMAEGEVLLYEWQAGAELYVDAHGEPQDYPASPAVRYEERDGVSRDAGYFIAPFDGLHGWFWLNTSEAPVTIRLRVSGWYEGLDEVYRD